MYTKGNFGQSLHTTANINNYKCQVWHKAPKNSCRRCRKLDHNTSQTAKCEAFLCDDDVITIKSPQFVLCNYFPCRVKVFDIEFSSSEHAYQWRYLKHIGMDELALEVLDAPLASEAKKIASRAPRDMHNEWHSIKACVMRQILHAKADYCEEFRSVLLGTAGNRLVEAVTGDDFWSSGLPPYLAASTKPQHFPGSNMLGSVLGSIREDLMKEVVLCKQLGIGYDIQGINPIINSVSSDELSLTTHLLPEISTVSDVASFDPICTSPTVSQQSTPPSSPPPSRSSEPPPSPSSSQHPSPSSSQHPSSSLPPHKSPSAPPSPPTFVYSTSSRLSSSHTCSEPEDLTLHCVASTSKPTNQVDQLSTQQLKKKKSFKKINNVPCCASHCS